MDQLLQLSNELQDSIGKLNYNNDKELIKYLSGQLQHLINLTECKYLSPEQKNELVSREHTIKIFKKFYTYLLVTDQLH